MYLSRLLSLFRPFIRMGKFLRPYVKAGTPTLFLVLFIGILVWIWWFGPRFEMGKEFPLKSVSVRLMCSIVLTLFVLVLIGFFQRKEMVAYYKAKNKEELFEADEKTPYIERQNAELQKLMLHLKKNYRETDYLYDLPWYLMIGLDSSGKTSLLNRSGQDFLFSTTMKAAQFKSGNPYSYHWWINDKAVFIDPDSGLLSQAPKTELDQGKVDPQISRHLWLHFLDWLGTTRPRRPLNGVILTVDIAYLANSNAAVRKVYAGILRARLRELMEVLSSRLPIYIVLTKFDLLNGFGHFFKQLTKAQRQEVFGFTFSLDASNDSDAWLHDFGRDFKQFVEKMNNLLPTLLMQTRDEEARRDLYSFTRQISGLDEILTSFLKEVLVSDKFSTSPIVRGVYFTSAYQQGAPMDVFINTTAKRYKFYPLITRSQNNQNSTPFFTYDLFEKIIFKEAGLASDNTRIQHKKQRKLATSAILTSVGAVLGVMLFHFFYVQNSKSAENVLQHVYTFKKMNLDQQLDPTGKLLVDPLNSIRSATLEFGFFRDRLKYISDTGLYLGHKIGPEVERTYLRLLAYRYLPALISGVAKDLSEADANSDEQLEMLRIFRMLVNKNARQPEIIKEYFGRFWQKHFEGDAVLQDNLMQHLDYALKYTDLDYDRSVKLRDAEKVLAPYDNLVLKAQTDLSIMPMEQRVYRSFRQFGLSALGAPLDLRLEVGPAFDLIFDIRDDQQKNTKIPRLFTKLGIDKYYTSRSENISELALIDNWVIGKRDDINFSDEDKALFREKLREQYGTDYEGTWRKGLNALNIKDFKDINHGVLILENIIGTTQPFQRLLLALKENTKLFPALPEDDVARQALVKSHVYLLSSKIDSDFSKLNNLYLPVVKDGKVEKPAFIEEVLIAIQNLHSYLKYIQNAQDVGQVALRSAKERLQLSDADLIFALKRIAERLPEPMDVLVEKLADETWNVILLEAVKEIDRKWNQSIYQEFNKNMAHKFPFNRNATNDVSLEEFERFFGEKGVVHSFYENELKLFLDESLFKNKQGTTYKSLIKEEVIAQLETAQKIRRAFFNQRGVLGVEFTLSPISMGPHTQRSVLNIEGQYVEYMHGPRRVYSLIWPNTAHSKGEEAVVKLTMIAAKANQTQPIISYQGPWAFFRMLDQANLSNTGQNSMDIIFNVKATPMRYQLIANGETNPFAAALLRSFKLAPSLYK